ncbi:hypothetical protein SO694_00043171 [Aureococcus anophagefferens]|uniref:Uncharacterized protein n=1 Tax=Aureococcus anophagefferens TaxID=44056 RepID=A0ABR1G739_AURAN
MSGTQDWLLSRCEAEARSSSGHLVELLTVQSVVAEPRSRGGGARRGASLSGARGARRAATAFGARACLRGVLDDVAKCRLVARVAEGERLKLKRAEGEARKVPALEREVSRLARELEAARRREARGGQLNGTLAAPEKRAPPRLTLVTLEDKLVLKVFSFLTAWGVLASAQADRAFFARVDKLFGMGSAVAGRLKAGGNKRANGRSPPPGAAGSLSAETAAAIASKLNAGEIKGIIALDQRAKRLDGECAMLKAEKEDLKAALEGAEGVKDFLGAKLRDAEETLKAAFEADETQRSQRRSDQEVINFLDARVRDLEAEAAGLRARRDSVEADLSRDRDAAVKQLAHVVASRDADLDERDRGDKANREQKRLLVKEVKALRAQLAAVHRAAARRV